MSKQIDMSVTVGALRLKNPVLAASGTVAFGEELAANFNAFALGGIVLKTVTPGPRQGHKPPRVIETSSGMINAIGLENPGIDVLITEHLPRFREQTVIVSIYSETAGDLKDMALRLAAHEAVSAIEVNLSCPNLKKGITVWQSTTPDKQYR